MSGWLDPVRHALDEAPIPVTFFFRDDDAGWDDDRLLALLELFAAPALPIDLAVIPTAVTASLARTLRGRVEATPELVGVHQHGFAHVNHEPDGRRYEFGPARSTTAQREDIEQGRRRLWDLLGSAVQPIFTPPWNRCTVVTGECVRDLGFAILSRDASAHPLELPGLLELPIRLDWAARPKGIRLTHTELGQRLAHQVRAQGPIGIMFHHAVMDATERAVLGELLDLLARHSRARCRAMSAVLDTATTAAVPGARDGWPSFSPVRDLPEELER